jgi:hypothetical protein
MIKAFATALVAALAAWLLALIVTAVLAERMSARQAGNALLLSGLADLMILAASVWLYRWLGASWGQAPVPTWSLLLFGALAVLAGSGVLLFTMLLLNR